MLLILFLFSALALAAPLDLPLDLNTFINLTTRERCSRSEEWQAYAFLVEDCFTAIQAVYLDKVLNKPLELYEFVGRGTYPKTKKPYVRTPTQFVVSEYNFPWPNFPF